MHGDLDVGAPAVAEIQGLYGAFSFPEKLLQKLWLRGDFDRSAIFTTAGQRVRVIHPGKWNLLGGPDFTGARLDMGGAPAREIHGDVEVHLHAADWNAHGHARDPAYDHVLLHVVLFPPEPGEVTRGAGGREIPVVALLPHLHRSLEEYAADEAVETLANRPLARLAEELGALSAASLAALLERHARGRWEQKVHFSRIRLQRLGWEAACHYAALEILGYRFNRAPMLRVASRWPRQSWIASEANPQLIYDGEAGGWSVQGVRPANRPRVRLEQYAAWTHARPDWPTRLLALSLALPRAEWLARTRAVRRSLSFSDVRERLLNEVVGGAVGGTRLDNLICDGFLPLLAAQNGAETAGLWFHWYPGDFPPFLISGLRQLGHCDGRIQPASHGAGQGLLGWYLERERRP